MTWMNHPALDELRRWLQALQDVPRAKDAADVQPDQALSAALRDAYFVVRQGQLQPQDADLARALVRELADQLASEGLTWLDGLSLSPHPTRAHQALRFLPAQAIEAPLAARFARPVPERPDLIAAFIDPRQLSLHCFENILPLDDALGLLGELTLTPQAPASSAALRQALHEAQVTLMTLGGQPEALQALHHLASLDLYVTPLASGQRGGQRFIFHSARLAQALTDALRRSAPRALTEHLVHVNPVFRCNRFMPSDRPFGSHRDSPYHDPALGHHSTHTLLLYLTAGAGGLRVEGATLDAIEAMTCVIFPQRAEHEGWPFAHGPKLFLRTELIMRAQAPLPHDETISRWFARACYLTLECPFAPALERLAHEDFERVAKARWSALGPKPTHEPFLLKRYRDAVFLTNGHEYWFMQDAHTLQEAATLAVLDLLNASFDGTTMRAQCQTTLLQGRPDWRWAVDTLTDAAAAHQAPSDAPQPPALCALPKAHLAYEPERPDPVSAWPDEPEVCEYDPWFDDGEPARVEPIIALQRQALERAMARLARAPIFILGRELCLDPSRFVIRGDAIHILSEARDQPLHFAGMVFHSIHASDFIQVEHAVEAPHLLVPPIFFARRRGCLRLTLDLLRGGWTTQLKPSTVELPSVCPTP